MSNSRKNTSGSSNEIVSLQKEMWRYSQGSCCEEPYMSSRKNGGEGQ